MTSDSIKGDKCRKLDHKEEKIKDIKVLLPNIHTYYDKPVSYINFAENKHNLLLILSLQLKGFSSLLSSTKEP